MSKVQESQDEFFVVLKIDDAGAYRNVSNAIEPLLTNEHVDLVDIQLLKPDLLAKEGDELGFDLTNDEDVRRLVEAAPSEKQKDAKQAVALLRSIMESITEISDGSGQVAAKATEMAARIRNLGETVRDATRRSKDKLTELGF